MRRTILLSFAAMAAAGMAGYYAFPYMGYAGFVLWALSITALARAANKEMSRFRAENRKLREAREKEQATAKKSVQDAGLRAAHEKEIREAREEDLAAARELIERYREERQRMIAEGPRVIFQRSGKAEGWKDPDDIYRNVFKEL